MEISTSYDNLTQLLQITPNATSTASNASATFGSASTTTTTCDSGASDTDTATWSAVAQSLSNSDSQFISPILKYKSQNQALQQQLTDTLASKFTDLGIDSSQPITLSRDAAGKVVVSGDNADKDKIEQLFSDTSVLTQAFNTLADNSATLKSMTSQQASAVVRTNGYAAYLTQLTNDSSTSDFFMSLADGVSSTYFG